MGQIEADIAQLRVDVDSLFQITHSQNELMNINQKLLLNQSKAFRDLNEMGRMIAELSKGISNLASIFSEVTRVNLATRDLLVSVDQRINVLAEATVDLANRFVNPVDVVLDPASE